MALLTKYIIFGTHFPNISGFAAAGAICGPAEAELSSGVCLNRGYADLIGIHKNNNIVAINAFIQSELLSKRCNARTGENHNNFSCK